MKLLLNLCILIPLVGFLVGAILPSKRESLISRAASVTMILQFLAITALLVAWMKSDFPESRCKRDRTFQGQ
jgi:NADH:ubiquinone oxidoreductase subunit 4 (subunit M)